MRPLTCAAAVLVLLAGCGQSPSDPGVTAPLPSWSWELPACPAYHPDDYDAPAHRVTVRVTDDGTITEVYETGWGPRALVEIQEVVRVCGEYEPVAADYLEQHQVVARGFAAADESLLVRTVRLAPHTPVVTRYTTVVRRGDTVTVQVRDCAPVTDETPVVGEGPVAGESPVAEEDAVVDEATCDAAQA